MAVATFVHSQFADGLVRLEFDYRDTTGDVLRFRCVNDSDAALLGEVAEVDPATDVRTSLWSDTFAARTTVEKSINRFKLGLRAVDADRDGTPETMVLDLGDYQIGARWPAV